MPSKLKLTVEKGPSAGREISADHGEITIGRSPRATLSLTGDEFISNEHATLIEAGDVWALRNHSPNGTLLNGRPVTEATVQSGDRIAIGMQHLIHISVTAMARAAAVSAPPPAATTKPAGQTPGTIRTTPKAKIPMWLMVYFGLMAVGFLALVVVKATGGKQAGFAELLTQEQQYADGLKLPAEQTSRVLRLLETAEVHELRGDTRSAYEAYRELLGARAPIEPQSPAYRYAAARIARLGPK